MLQHTTIPLKRAWNTWSDRPAEMVFLPLGVRITPILYSTRSRTTSAIEPRRDKVRLGHHAIDGSRIELETDHSGTTIAFSTVKSDPFAIRGSWEGKVSGEWGLRFWVTIAIFAEGGETIRYDAEKGIALVKVGTRFLAVTSAEAPIQVTGHETIDALRADFENNGYFYLASRSDHAPVIAMRFNLEMMRRGAYAAAVADSAELAIEKARASLIKDVPAELGSHTGTYEDALDAIRDVVAWNTVWDETNARPYTAVTRIWNLGKFAVWYNDQTFAALLGGLFDADLARENMMTALAGATPQGNIACIVTSNDAWVDRSQPPYGALVVWQLYQRTGERSLLETSYEALARNQRWWRDNRDPNRAGLLSCGTSDVGEGLYKGSAFGARNETGMDNSATHDEAVYDPGTRTLSTFDLGLNCAAALDAEMLAKIAGVLGRHEDAREFEAIAKRSRNLISEELWDESRGIFANRQRKGGGFVRSLSPTSFYPLLCGAATQEQAVRLLEHLNDENSFAGAFVLPNATRNDPAFAENVYWRGRIWPNVNYMVWLGLRRYGFTTEASRLAGQSYDLFMKSWRCDRIAAENYNAVTGEAMDQGDTDPFYIWAALLPLMAVGELCDFDPWKGWTLTNVGRDVTMGPMLSAAGRLHVTIEDAVLKASVNGRLLISTDIRGTLSKIIIQNGQFSCLVDPLDVKGFITLAGVNSTDVVTARLNGEEITWTACAQGIRLDIPQGNQPRQLDVYFSGIGEASAQGKT